MSFAVFLNVLAHRKSLINFVLASHVLTFNLLITSISQLKCVCTYSTLVHINKLYTNRYWMLYELISIPGWHKGRGVWSAPGSGSGPHGAWVHRVPGGRGRQEQCHPDPGCWHSARWNQRPGRERTGWLLHYPQWCKWALQLIAINLWWDSLHEKKVWIFIWHFPYIGICKFLVVNRLTF